MLLALALADHASDDGTRVFPKIEALAEKTRQSVRSVQYQLRAMQESGWLIQVSHGNGGRSMSTEYRISHDWIKGAEIAPIEKGANDDGNGANDDTKGCNPQQKTVQRCAPANNRHRTIKQPSVNHQAQALGLIDVSDELLRDYNKVRAAKKAGDLTASAAKTLIREAAKAGISHSEAVEYCCGQGWQGFNAKWYADRQGPAKASAKPEPLTFAEQERRAGMQRWEEMTGQRHPGLDKLRETGEVVDALPNTTAPRIEHVAAH